MSLARRFFLSDAILLGAQQDFHQLNENKIINLGFPREGHILDKEEKVAIVIMDVLHFSSNK